MFGTDVVGMWGVDCAGVTSTDLPAESQKCFGVDTSLVGNIDLLDASVDSELRISCHGVAGHSLGWSS